MDGTDEDVFRAIGDSLVPTLRMEDITGVREPPLSRLESYVPRSIYLSNRVPELEEAISYSDLGRKVFTLSWPGGLPPGVSLSDAEAEQIGRQAWREKRAEEKRRKSFENYDAFQLEKTLFGSMAESSLTMAEGPVFWLDKRLELQPGLGYEGTTADTWMNATLGFFEGQRKLAREYYAVDPEFAESYAGKVAGAVGAAVPQLVAMRVPVAAVVGIGGQSFLHAWEDAENTAMRRGEKFDPNRAYAYATTMAALNTALTFLEFDKVLGPWRKGQSELLGDNLIKLFQSATGAGAVNAVQGGVNDLGATAFGIETRNPFDPERRWDDFTVGAGAGIVLGAGARMALANIPETPTQRPSEKPGITFVDSLGKQEVPPSVAESAKPDATNRSAAQSSDGSAGNSEKLTYVGKSEDLGGKPRAAVEGLQFRDATGTDQATRDRVSSLETALEEDARADGAHPGAGKVRLLEASVANHSAAGRATLRFVSGFEKLTGKKIYWIDTEGAASFAAIVDTARPNAIYLHVQGNRAIPALIGHEWGHTLKKQDPALYRDLQLKLLPLIDSWKARATALKSDGYRRQVRSEELTNNIIGDAFVQPDFWRFVAQRDRPLFARIVDSVNQWFASLRGKARQSEWGTEEFLGDIDEAHRAVMETFSQAVEKGPYSELRDTPGAELSNRVPDGAEIMYSRSARELLDGDKPVPTALALQAMREAPDHPVTRALKSWFVGGFRDIQSGKAPETEAILRKFLLRLSPYESKTPLYRGVPFRNEPELRAFLKQFQGDEWVNAMPFMSTTKELQLAYGHVKSSSYPVLLEIKNVHSGYDLEPFKLFAEQFKWQREVIYQKRTRFKVIQRPKIVDIGGKLVYFIGLEEE